MGNEFGHPEWIDFPREGNGWSYHYCRRQWSLVDNSDLKYKYLQKFEEDMVSLAKDFKILQGKDKQLYVHEADSVLAYQKGNITLVCNMSPEMCHDGYFIPVSRKGTYRVILSSDDFCYGGHGRVAHQTYRAECLPDGRVGIRLYLPNRTAIVLEPVKR